MSSLERDALLSAFDSNYIAPVGPALTAFEAAMCETLGGGVACVALSSGTAAIHLALQLLGVSAGDVVFAPTFTFVATINPIRYCGANPVLIGCEPRSWNLDPEALDLALKAADQVNQLPKAVIVADVYGQPADYDTIRPLCQRYGIPLLQDAAEALGSRHQSGPSGLQGDIGVFSFNGNKLLTTGGGGMLVMRDDAMAEHARKLASQARESVVYYEHTELGYNYRMSNLLAAIGCAQLQRLPDMVARCREHFAHYSEALADDDGVSMMPANAFGEANFWLSCIQLSDTKLRPANVCAVMEARDIEVRPLWKPMHRQPLYQSAPYIGSALADHLFAVGLCLPSGSAMPSHQRDRVIAALRQCLGNAVTTA